MGLKAYHVLGVGYLRQRLTNHKVELLLSLLKHLFIQYINIDSFIQKYIQHVGINISYLTYNI